MQEIQGNMDDVLSRNDLRDDEKTTRYFQLQNRYLAFKVTRPSFFGGVPSYFEALWYPHLYFYRKSNT